MSEDILGNNNNGGNSNQPDNGGDTGGENTLDYIVDSEGKFAENFKDALPEEIRRISVLDKYESFPEMVKGFNHLSSQLGKKVEKIPDAESSEDEINEFYTKLGRPEKPDGYKVERELPEDFPTDEKQFEEFKQVAHENNLTAKQLENIVKWHDKTQVAQMEEMKQQQEEQIKEYVEKNRQQLEKEFGRKTEGVMDRAKKTLNYLDPEGEIDKSENQYLKNNAFLVKLLNNVGTIISEDRIKGGGTDIVTDSGLDEQIDEINKKMRRAIREGDEKAMEEATKERDRVYEARWG